MIDEKCKEVLALYRKKFGNIEPAKHDPNANPCGAGYIVFRSLAVKKHLRAMLDEMDQFIAEGKREKFMRWLGFMQGVLWTQGVYTLDELKNHNRQ
jgi:hypothetical protein